MSTTPVLSSTSTPPLIVVIAGDMDTLEVRESSMGYLAVCVVDDRHRSVAHLDLTQARARDLLTQLTAALAVTA